MCSLEADLVKLSVKQKARLLGELSALRDSLTLRLSDPGRFLGQGLTKDSGPEGFSSTRCS